MSRYERYRIGEGDSIWPRLTVGEAIAPFAAYISVGNDRGSHSDRFTAEQARTIAAALIRLAEEAEAR